jgi:biopolymer transport protein TolQ
LRTLGSSYFALQLQAQGGGSSATTTSLVLQILAQSTSPIARGILLILALLSIGSWAIILYKVITLSRAQRQSASFLEVFRRSNKFSEVQSVCRSLGASPLVGLFQSGYAELTAQTNAGRRRFGIFPSASERRTSYA